MSTKLFFFDLETTGTKFWRNGIHEIGGIIDIDGEVKESINLHPRPHPRCDIEDEALKVGNVTREQIFGYEPMENIHTQLSERLTQYIDKYDKKDKFFLVGYNNAHFDNPFLRAFFTQCGDKYFGSYFWSGGIDVMVLALTYLQNKRVELENFKLSTVAQYLGIKLDPYQLHGALYDITLTRDIYYILKEKMNF